jgi:hypothetical protein
MGWPLAPQGLNAEMAGPGRPRLARATLSSPFDCGAGRTSIPDGWGTQRREKNRLKMKKKKLFLRPAINADQKTRQSDDDRIIRRSITT